MKDSSTGSSRMANKTAATSTEQRRHLKPILPKLPRLDNHSQTFHTKTCYICDERLNGSGIFLMHNSTPVTNSSLPTKIGQLMGDGFLVVVTHGDMVCRKCYALINHVDQLEADLKRIKSILRSHLLKKYNFSDSSINVGDTTTSTKVVHLIDTDDEIDGALSAENHNSGYRSIRPKPLEKKPLIQCTMCDKTFESPRAMNLHKMKEHLSTWTCYFCNAIFEREAEYLDHMPTHLSETPASSFECTDCNESFPSKDALAEHAESHKEVVVEPFEEKIASYSCNICAIDFLQEEVYNEHMQTHEDLNVLDLGSLEKASGLSLDVLANSESADLLEKMFENSDMSEDRFVCAECRAEYDSLEDFNAHFQSIHLHKNLSNLQEPNEEIHNTEKWACLCGTLIYDEEAYNLHLQECQGTNNAELSCPFCNTRAESRESLEMHYSICSKVQSLVTDNNITSLMVVENDQPDSTAQLIQVENNDEYEKCKINPFLTCTTCNATFETKQALQEHGKEFLDHFIIKCPDCDVRFRRERILNEHREQKHPKAHCRFCEKSFENLKQLKAHESRHARSGSCIYKCAKCNRVFQTTTGLKQHEAVHTGEFKYKCEFCGNGFVSRMRWEEHRASHTKEERYACDICDLKFSHQATYWIHRKWHKNPKPYKCEDCGRLFKHTSLLAVHKRKHTGERPYSCPHCEQSFAVGNTLKRHLSLHTGIYPYTCEACSQGFPAKHKLAIHMSKVHQDHTLLDAQQNKKQQAFKMVVKEPPAETETDTIDLDEGWILSDGRDEYLALRTEGGEQILLTESMLEEQGDSHLVEIVLRADEPIEYSREENIHAVNNILEH